MTEPASEDDIEWELTTWQGARREAMRRWAALPLERIVAALEEMEALGRATGALDDGRPRAGKDTREPRP